MNAISLIHSGRKTGPFRIFTECVGGRHEQPPEPRLSRAVPHPSEGLGKDKGQGRLCFRLCRRPYHQRRPEGQTLLFRGHLERFQDIRDEAQPVGKEGMNLGGLQARVLYKPGTWV